MVLRFDCRSKIRGSIPPYPSVKYDAKAYDTYTLLLLTSHTQATLYEISALVLILIILLCFLRII